MTQHLHLDPFNGIAGDMFIGALLDLGLDLEDLKKALAPLGLEDPYELTATRVLRQGVGGVDFKVHVGCKACDHDHDHDHDHAHAHDHKHDHAHDHKHDDHAHEHKHEPATHKHDDHAHDHKHDHKHDHAHDHKHDDHAHDHKHDHGHKHDQGHSHAPAKKHLHVGYLDVVKKIDLLDTTPRGKVRARRIVDALALAEAQVHRKPIDQVHFHEVGAIDSIVDMLGAAVAVELLKIDSLSCGPLPIGRGFVRCDHGKMPLPAPATAYILRGMPTIGVERNQELVTPTGAAIIKGLCDTMGAYPNMTLSAVGYGAGDRDDKEVPNLLRVFLGVKEQRAAQVFNPR